MKRTLLILIPFLISFCLYSQEFDVSLQFAANRTFINLDSDYEIDPNLDPKGIIGGNLGANLNLRFDNFSIRNYVGLQLTFFKYDSDNNYKDIFGNLIGKFDRTIGNFSFQYIPLVSYNFNNGIFLGTGASMSFLLLSRFKNQGLFVNGVSTEGIEWLNNNQYRKFAIDLPFIFGYEWNKNSIFLNYTLGLTNRNGKESLISERHSILMIGYNLSLSKKAEN